jgi:hypothetical protein
MVRLVSKASFLALSVCLFALELHYGWGLELRSLSSCLLLGLAVVPVLMFSITKPRKAAKLFIRTALVSTWYVLFVVFGWKVIISDWWWIISVSCLFVIVPTLHTLYLEEYFEDRKGQGGLFWLVILPLFIFLDFQRTARGFGLWPVSWFWFITFYILCFVSMMGADSVGEKKPAEGDTE